MTIIQKTHLDDNEILIIRTLEKEVNDFDDLSIKLYLNTEFNIVNDIPLYYLMFIDHQLVSFLMIFMPTYNEAEIMGYTNPFFRRRGYFSKLLEEAKNNLNKYSPLDLLFVCDDKSLTGKNYVNTVKSIYSFSEFKLKLNQSIFSDITNINTKLILEKAKLDDVNDINNVYVSTFSLDNEASRNMVLKTLDSKQKTQYVLRLDGIIIAAAVVSMEDDLICIIGVAVDIKYQNQGFGYQMMSMIITNLLKINVTNIMIEVDSLNQRAFHLYQKLGFVKQEENQYYRLKFEKRKCD